MLCSVNYKFSKLLGQALTMILKMKLCSRNVNQVFYKRLTSSSMSTVYTNVKQTIYIWNAWHLYSTCLKKTNCSREVHISFVDGSQCMAYGFHSNQVAMEMSISVQLTTTDEAPAILHFNVSYLKKQQFKKLKNFSVVVYVWVGPFQVFFSYLSNCGQSSNVYYCHNLIKPIFCKILATSPFKKNRHRRYFMPQRTEPMFESRTSALKSLL